MDKKYQKALEAAKIAYKKAKSAELVIGHISTRNLVLTDSAKGHWQVRTGKGAWKAVLYSKVGFSNSTPAMTYRVTDVVGGKTVYRFGIVIFYEMKLGRAEAVWSNMAGTSLGFTTFTGSNLDLNAATWTSTTSSGDMRKIRN
ncbi:MAG: hypothetical protein AAF479_13995 [Pseudomonadota bacterium]